MSSRQISHSSAVKSSMFSKQRTGSRSSFLKMCMKRFAVVLSSPDSLDISGSAASQNSPNLPFGRRMYLYLSPGSSVSQV